MVPTLLGISLICFLLIQMVPGGPVEEMIAKTQAAGNERGARVGGGLTAEEIQNIKVYFGFDKPIHVRYWEWVCKVAQFDLGYSYTYRKPVWDVISSKFPISLFFGIVSFFLAYLICIPLGVYKALWNRSWFDTISSIVIFSGYVMPGYALGILLIVFFAGGEYFNLFPLSGIISDNHEDFTGLGKVLDFLHHMVLPLICYMASEFAFLTLLMKNTLLDELGKDYMRTAQVKGASYQTAVWKHAMRNALIPLATRMSEIFTLLFTSALLIERVFDIDGMGLLFYNSMISRDYNVVMGLIFLSSGLAMVGRLFSDILYVWVDPRISLK